MSPQRAYGIEIQGFCAEVIYYIAESGYSSVRTKILGFMDSYPCHARSSIIVYEM